MLIKSASNQLCAVSQTTYIVTSNIMVTITYTHEEKKHHQNVVVKNIIFHSSIVFLFAYFANKMAISNLYDYQLNTNSSKVIFSFLMMFQISYAWYVLLTSMKDKVQDSNYHCKEMVGHFCFLTHITFSVLTTYTTFNFTIHFARYVGINAPIIDGTGYMLNCICLPVNTLGLTVTFLFLKLCFFEENWRIMMKIIEKRIPTILNSQLVTHLIPLVHATFDMFIFRDCKAVLKLTGSVYTLMKIFGIIGITFEIYLETLCYFNGGFYPYPVLYKLNTLQKKIIFVIVVWLFTSFLAISLRFLLGLLIKFYP